MFKQIVANIIPTLITVAVISIGISYGSGQRTEV